MNTNVSELNQNKSKNVSLFSTFKETKENKLRQTIEEFRDELKSLKTTLNKVKELELLRE